MKYILILGSNLGQRENNLEEASALIAGYFSVYKRSSLYETQALLLDDSLPEHDLDFLNIALSIEVPDSVTPHELLVQLKEIEQQVGREANYPTWTPRVIDIDIALAEVELETPKLSIPHKGFLARDFFIVPAQEIEPDFYIPKFKLRLADIKIDKITQNIIKKYE